MADPEKREPLVVECADGKMRAVTFDLGVSLSLEPVHTADLSERQKRGLGLPEGYAGPLLEISQPSSVIPRN